MYKVLLIGAGNAGLLYEFDPKRKKPASHYGGILSFPEKLQLSAVCDIDKGKEKFLKEKNINVPFYFDYKKAIEEIKPDIITIASWTKTHKDIFIHALENGVKGIVLEKPIARNLKEGKKMIDRWKEHKIPVVVNHERRWDAKYTLAKQIIEKGEIGKIKAIYGKVLLGSIPRDFQKLMLDLEGGGPLIHDGTHLIDLLLYFFKDFEIKDVYIEKDGILETRVIALFFVKNEYIPIFVEIGGERDYFHFSIEIEGSRGKLIVGNGIKELYIAEESTLYSGFNDLKKIRFPLERLRNNMTFNGPYFEILKALKEKKQPFSNLIDGYKALQKIEEIYHFNSKK